MEIKLLKLMLASIFIMSCFTSIYANGSFFYDDGSLNYNLERAGYYDETLDYSYQFTDGDGVIIEVTTSIDVRDYVNTLNSREVLSRYTLKASNCATIVRKKIRILSEYTTTDDSYEPVQVEISGIINGMTFVQVYTIYNDNYFVKTTVN